MTVAIGKIIKSSSHIDYVCQVFGRGEAEYVPTPEDYALGTWVWVPLGPDKEHRAVGLVYDTQLFNPDYGTFGPRLSTPEQLEVFSPDYLNETATLVGILLVGCMAGKRRITSGYSPVVPQLGAVVTRMEDEDVCAFHTDGNTLDVSYYSLLMRVPNPLAPFLLSEVLAKLEQMLPTYSPIINALHTNLAWNTRVDAAG